MADMNNGAATPTPAPNSGGGQVQPATGGNDSVSISRAEYDKFVRYGDQVKGIQPFFEKAKNFGIQRPEDFDRYEPHFKSIQELEKRGVKPDMLSRMYSQEADDDVRSEQQQSQFDPAKFEKDFEAKMERKLAEKEWESLTKKESDYVDVALREIFGDEQVDDMSKAVYRGAVENYLDKNREMYPKEHPLHSSHLQPLNESHAKKAAEFFKAEKAKYAGASMKGKADAVNATRQKPSTPAGPAPNQGPAKNEATKKTAKAELDEAVEEVFSRRK